MQKWTVMALAAAGVLVFYAIHYGLATVLPGNINWLMSVRHDWGTHYLGWAFFKDEPWHFPLGKITTYNYPIGTNVGFTDSIPLMAIFFKLFAHWLPADFQYFGLWLLLCHLLAAYFTVLLFRLFKVNRFITVLAALFIATNPVLVYRGMHPALCAHWLLIACIYVYFLDPAVTGTRRILLYQFILLALSAMINPYLCWMVLGFSAATPVRLCFFDKALSKKDLLLYLGLSLFAMVFLWYVTGLVDFQKKEDLDAVGAYGRYSLNLNSLFNSFGYSSFIHRMPWVNPMQYEGYMYLGVGMFLLLLVLFGGYLYKAASRGNSVTAARTGKRRSLVPLLVLVFLYTVLAVTLVFTYNDKILFKIPAPGVFIWLEEIFRACSRFFWTPYYLILLFTIIGISKMRMNPLIPSALVAVAFVIQVYDLHRLLGDRGLARGSYTPPMDNSAWVELMGKFDQIVFLPPFHTPAIHPMDYQDFCYLALKAHKPITAAYVARGDSRGMRRYTDSVNRQVELGHLSPDALYITGDADLDQFSFPVKTHAASLHALDGCYYLISNEVKDKMLDMLTTRLDEENHTKLDSAMKTEGEKMQFMPVPKLPVANSGTITNNLETVVTGLDYISIRGWAFLDSARDNTEDSLFLTMTSGPLLYRAAFKTFGRDDVTAGFAAHPHNPGARILAFTDSIPKAKYQLGLSVKTAQGGYVHRELGREFEVKYPEYGVPVKLTALPPAGKIRFDIQLDDKPSEFSMTGWAAQENRDADNCTIWVLLRSNENTFAVGTVPEVRKDVTAAMGNKYRLDNSGYRVKIAKKSLPAGTYQIGILIRDAGRHKAVTALWYKTVTVK